MEAKQNSSYGHWKKFRVFIESFIRAPEEVPGIYRIVHMGIGSSSGYLRICPDHSGVVPGGAGTYENGTGEVLDQPK